VIECDESGIPICEQDAGAPEMWAVRELTCPIHAISVVEMEIASEAVVSIAMRVGEEIGTEALRTSLAIRTLPTSGYLDHIIRPARLMDAIGEATLAHWESLSAQELLRDPRVAQFISACSEAGRAFEFANLRRRARAAHLLYTEPRSLRFEVVEADESILLHAGRRYLAVDADRVEAVVRRRVRERCRQILAGLPAGARSRGARAWLEAVVRGESRAVEAARGLGNPAPLLVWGRGQAALEVTRDSEVWVVRLD
jgi:hypothetical protein